MTTTKITYLNAGGGALVDNAIGLFGVDFHSFVIGDAYDFDTLLSETSPRGNITFTGDRALISSRRFDAGKSFRVNFTIPEIYDDILVGNMVAYAYHGGRVQPVLSLVLSDLVHKQNTQPNSSLSPDYKYTGNRLVIGINVKFVAEADLEVDIVVQVVTPEFASLPYIATDLQIPAGVENPHTQFVVNEMTATGGAPALVSKDPANVYWTTPLWQDIDSPKYGVLTGQFETPAQRAAPWVWNGRYTDTRPARVIGSSYLDEDVVTYSTLRYEDF